MSWPDGLARLEDGPEKKIVLKFFSLISSDSAFQDCFNQFRLVESWKHLLAGEVGSLMVAPAPNPDVPLPSERTDITVEIMVVANLLPDDLSVPAKLWGLTVKNLLRKFCTSNTDLITNDQNIPMTFAQVDVDWVGQNVEEQAQRRTLVYRVRYHANIDPTQGTFT
jgi:hypothetical protein